MRAACRQRAGGWQMAHAVIPLGQGAACAPVTGLRGYSRSSPTNKIISMGSEHFGRRCLGRLAWVWLLAWVVVAPALAAGRFVVGPQGAPMALEDAVRVAQDGDVIELLPGEYAGGLVLEMRKLSFVGVGSKPPVIKGAAQPGKAKGLWVVRGGAVSIENLEFRGARSVDGDGAGVRQEGGKLSLRLCNFFDNEHGLLAANDEAAEVSIDSSVFGAAPKVVGGLYHLLNVGRIARLSISGSRFQQGFEGHMIKTRARVNDITYNFIHDGQRGGASYEIEIANGGLATVLGNVIGQGADSQNPVVVAYGTEDRSWDKNALYLAHNTFVHYGWLPGWFLRVIRKNLPDSTEVFAINNLIVGPGAFWLGASGHFDGNRQATLGMLRDAETYAFELPPGSMWRSSGVDPRQVGGRDLSPKAEFKWPVGTEALTPGREQWAPGAYQR
jgi:hypothetical protein